MKYARYTHQYQYPWWFLIIVVWKRVIDDPDLSWLALCMIMGGLIMPWLLRFLALIVGPAMVGLGIVFLVTGIIRGFQRVAMRVIQRRKGEAHTHREVQE